MTVIDFGIVFDIDGVVLRGGELIPGAKETIQKVAALGVPHLFFTNNGMETEEMRAKRLGKQLGLCVNAERLVLCHSALKSEAASIGDGLVLVSGYCHMDSVALMKAIGFKNVQTIDEYAAFHPNLCPMYDYPSVQNREWADARVEMIVLLDIIMNWAQDIQIICDLMMYGGYTSSKANNLCKAKSPRLVLCNFDMTYAAAHEALRLGPGAFVHALCSIYHQLTNEELEFIKHGKPHAPMYVVAEQRLRQQAHQQQNLRRIYAIGDNPQSDIRGANNAGQHWTSILVRTGCFQGSQNDSQDPADYVVHDITEAVHLILKLENRF